MRHAALLTPLILLVALLALVSERPGEPAANATGCDATCLANAKSSGIPRKWWRHASFERSLRRHTDGWHIDSPFRVRRTTAVGGTAGTHAAKIVTHGGNTRCSCSRMKYQRRIPSLGPGDEVWLSGSWRIRNPSRLAWTRLMNVAHFEYSDSPYNWYLALETTTAGTMQVGYAAYGDPHTPVLPPHKVPVHRWFRADLHFVLSPYDGQALNQWYINRRLVASSTVHNMYNPRPLTFYNGGLPYFWDGNGGTTVYFDAPRLRWRQR